MKLLYILNVANRVNNFSYTSMVAAKEMGCEFHIAGNWNYKSEDELKADEEKYSIHIHQIDFERNPLSLKNYKAYKQLSELFDRWDFDAVHCNTPIGGVLGRIVAKKNGVSPVLYQAHGFHFYKGAPFLNWLIYYSIERLLAKLTDTIIVINQEDYDIAQKFKLRNSGKVYYVPGVGIDTTCYQPGGESFRQKRQELGINEDDIMLISAGDLIERKNYKVSIKAIAETGMTNLKYCICGTGPQLEELKEYAKNLGVESQILFLGFRSDMKELLGAADIFLFTTKQEGLPRSMMEAMATGLPCVASRVRGNIDLLEGCDGGFLCDVESASEFADAIKKLAEDKTLRKEFGNACVKHIMNFDINAVVNGMKDIYTEVLK